MSIAQNLSFTKPQLEKFAKLFRQARKDARMTQLEVAQAAFDYKVSHCKVSRVERAAMPCVDAHCLELMADVLEIPRKKLLEIDPKFQARAVVARVATRKGLWDVPALLTQ
jgi:transcriptional regulator with XRE-family HTH domain